MTKTFKALTIAAAMAVPMVASFQIASAQTVAGRGPILQINHEGKHACRSFASTGQPYWEAKIRGRTDHDYAASSNRFVVRTCFSTRSQCVRFIDRIHHRIMGIEQIYYSRCSAY